MERALVTGVAGFIGSSLAERLRELDVSVVGVDCLTPYYERSQKQRNIAPLLADDGFRFVDADLRTADLDALVADADVVFHQAGQPGVRLSWSEGFTDYLDHNVLATQRLLEALRGHPVQRFVFASSSSVYGQAERWPTTEDDLPRPHSPYGVTKLAAEHLCGLYAANWDIPTVSLRYFTVYGPRQRPDMAIHRLCRAALTGEEFPLYGDGTQVRDFTYVADVVEANLAAAHQDVKAGTVMNVAGGAATSMSDLIDLVGRLSGRPVRVDRRPAQAGDVRRTGGSIDRARDMLGWAPAVDLEVGLGRQLAWHRAQAPQR